MVPGLHAPLESRSDSAQHGRACVASCKGVQGGGWERQRSLHPGCDASEMLGAAAKCGALLREGNWGALQSVTVTAMCNRSVGCLGYRNNDQPVHVCVCEREKTIQASFSGAYHVSRLSE